MDDEQFASLAASTEMMRRNSRRRAARGLAKSNRSLPKLCRYDHLLERVCTRWPSFRHWPRSKLTIKCGRKPASNRNKIWNRAESGRRHVRKSTHAQSGRWHPNCWI